MGLPLSSARAEAHASTMRDTIADCQLQAILVFVRLTHYRRFRRGPSSSSANMVLFDMGRDGPSLQ